MRTLRKIHRWLGLVLALPLIVQGVSGAILALEPVFPSGLDPAPAGLQRRLDEMLHAAQAVASPASRLSRYVAPAAADGAAQVHFAPRSGPPRGGGETVLVDPVSLTVLGRVAANAGAFGLIRSLHTNFLVPGPAGRSVAGWVGVGLLALALLGLPLWWPRSGEVRAAFTVRSGASGRRLHRELHGAVGIWSLLILLVMAVTGIALAFPQTVRSAMGLGPGGGFAQGPAVTPADAAPEYERAVAAAEAAAPGQRMWMLVFPVRPSEAVRVLLTPNGTESVARMTTVFVDPWAGRVVSVQPSGALPMGERVFRWMHDLHSCLGIGPLWRTLAVASGLALPVFAVTGTMMWLIARRNRRRLERARRAALTTAEI